MLSRCWAVGTHCGCTDCTGCLILCCGPLVGCVSVFPSSYCTRGHDIPGIPLYLSIPLAANMAGTAGAGATPLVLFCGSTMVIFTMYGGGFATFPAYIADLFGTKYGSIGVFFFFFMSMHGLVVKNACRTNRRKLSSLQFCSFCFAVIGTWVAFTAS